MPTSKSSEMATDLFGEPIPLKEKVVNVASVPHRSPFRYPGGKTWLVPRIRQWVRSLSQRPAIFVEPFAGGAIVGLTVAFEDLAERVILVELDQDVAAVWQTIFSDDNEWLAKRILNFEISIDAVRAQVADEPKSRRDRAFKTLLKNRTFHGGILAAGSAPIRFGEGGKGIASRWYAKTLARRIRDLHGVRDSVEIVNGDGISVIQQNARNTQAVFFIDPPYTAAGKKAGQRLYTHHSLDHELLFQIAEGVTGDFLMTYDLAESLIEMANRHGFETRQVAMKNTHHAVMSELLIGRELSWVQ